jgi:DNA-directed RNA polymerase subunit L
MAATMAAASGAGDVVPPIVKSVRYSGSTESTAWFDFRGFSTAFVNTLRRKLLSDVRGVAMVAEPVEDSTIVIKENHSRLNNQFLALRISLIPVHIPPPNYGGESSVLDRYEIRIDKMCDIPGGEINVTTDDIMIYDRSTGGFLEKGLVQKIFPRETLTSTGGLMIKNISNPIHILPLRGPRGEQPGESVKIRAGLKVGTGGVHPCFSQVSAVSYEIAEGATAADSFGKTMNAEYRFSVESLGVQTPESLLAQSADELIRHIVNIQTELRTIERQGGGNSPLVETVIDGEEMLFMFKNEGYTLGMLLQDYVLQLVRQRTPERFHEWFVGVRIPHPLTPQMVVRVSSRGITNIVNMIQQWLIPALEMARVDAEFVGKEILRQASDYVKPHPLSFMLKSDYIPVVEKGMPEQSKTGGAVGSDEGPVLSR